LKGKKKEERKRKKERKKEKRNILQINFMPHNIKVNSKK